ncbi:MULTISPECIES: tetratricopeptide repeat protein [Bizionia]|uniref:Tetratricopeptide repeat protein n=1 Tax=Bizionia algoritergicola TaxID=291187 RepID=A0A5D0QPV0_9FLAO|nr:MULTISPECIES: hypothetical protein [Bizionia]OBX22551.1 hypothetical protein BAA08_08000 [Bizionia sp. APA-3]TYB70741.1 hypothetical protein ES675_14620 [Bizionia algoritergicola]
MKSLIITFILLMGVAAQGQTNFEKGMTKAFSMWQSDNMNGAEQLFERIADAEPDEWLPSYYIAQINSLKSWTEKDVSVLTSQLEKAQNYIDMAKAIDPNNAEILVMQAQIYTNWVAFDGAIYGMKYSSIINELYKQAYKLDPENPRVVLNKAEWEMGSAKFFGKDTKPYCEDIARAIELCVTFKPASDFHPNWGKERAEQVLANCK